MDSAASPPPPSPPEQGATDDFVRRAVILFGEKRFTEAAKICRLGLLADPRRLDGRLVLGRALMALSAHDDVLAEMTATLEQDPDNYRALLLKAEALVRMQSYAQARDVLIHVEDLDPFNHQASQLLDYLDEELEHGDGPVARVTTDTRQYPSSKARDITVTAETGAFLEQSTAEALRELSTRGGVGSGPGPEALAEAPGEDALEGDWEEEESTLMDMAPAFDEREDTPLQESSTWDGQPGDEPSALQASPTWEGAITGTGEAPLQAAPTLEDAGVLAAQWDGGGEVEGLESTVTEDEGAAWDGGGEVETMEPTVTEGEDAAWDGGGEVESMEPTVTEGKEKPNK